MPMSAVCSAQPASTRLPCLCSISGLNSSLSGRWQVAAAVPRSTGEASASVVATISHCPRALSIPGHSQARIALFKHSTWRIPRTAACASMPANTVQLANQYLSWDWEPHSRSHIQKLVEAGAAEQLQELLGKRLEFGTAGLRGKMGAGYNRMNSLVVRQTAQGLSRYLQQQCPETLKERGVVIGYDGRHGSKAYAAITAAVMLSQGVPVALFSKLVPTPFVAAGVAELGAAAGVMVTASHNPKEYNGYKVYWGNGCQIIPPHDEGIAAAIEANLEPWPLTGSLNPRDDIDSWMSDMRGHALMSDPLHMVSAQYYSKLKAKLQYRTQAANASAAPVVYTPLHGVGLESVLQAFELFNLPAPHVVQSQAQPDPEFPTVVFPNPEEGKGVWTEAFKTADAKGARLAIANDPDADRLAVAERCATAPGGWRTFTGNEIGALLAHWVWTQFKSRNPEVPASKCAMLASTVSSKFLGAMATQEGFKFEQTLTGFKWLGNRALELEAQGSDVLFAFEEAIGFMLGGMYKDKDGVSAAVVFAEMAAELYSQGTTVTQHLESLYQQYSFLAYRAGYFIADQPAMSAAVFDRLRHQGQYASAVGGIPVTAVRDLGTGLDTSQPDQKAVLPWRAGDMMITYTLQGDATLTLRASGTEPKLKYYLEVADKDAESAARLAEKLEAAVASELVKVQESGLQLPAHS